MSATGYHIRPIKKGVLGEVSKIREELEELEDSLEQGCKIMALVELGDLLGAVEAVAENMGVTLQDLLRFSDITKRAFKNGKRE